MHLVLNESLTGEKAWKVCEGTREKGLDQGSCFGRAAVFVCKRQIQVRKTQCYQRSRWLRSEDDNQGQNAL